MRKIIGVAFLLLVASAANSQTPQLVINRQNKTVDVTVTVSVSMFADLAEVKFSCTTKLPSHEEAYQKNVERSDKIVKALLDTGVPKNDIVSAGISLGEEDRSAEEIKANPKRPPLYEASQTWTVRVAAGDAQKVIDAAIQAGADSIEDVKWMLSNPDAAVSHARIAAVQMARANATEIAAGLGAKLGEAIYVSNVSVSTTLLARDKMYANVTTPGVKQVTPPGQQLQLFPDRIEKEATVHVIFALE